MPESDTTPAVLRAAADEIENLRAVGDRLQQGAEELIAFVERRFPKDEDGDMDAEAYAATTGIGNASLEWLGVRGTNGRYVQVTGFSGEDASVPLSDGASVGQIAERAADLFGITVGPQDSATLAVEGTALHPTEPMDGRIDPDYMLVIVGGAV